MNIVLKWLKQFIEPFVVTERNNIDFDDSSKCWIFKKENGEGEVKVKDHDHITRKYWGSAHQECNLNYV